MIISVQKGLDGIKSRLEDKGYRIVDFDNSKGIIDAYIYYGKCENDFSFETAAEITSLDFSINARKKVKMINCRNKSFNEIELELISSDGQKKERRY